MTQEAGYSRGEPTSQALLTDGSLTPGLTSTADTRRCQPGITPWSNIYLYCFFLSFTVPILPLTGPLPLHLLYFPDSLPFVDAGPHSHTEAINH